MWQSLTAGAARYKVASAQARTNLDALDSRSALINSLTAYVNAVYDIEAARSGLVYSLGDDVPVGMLRNK